MKTPDEVINCTTSIIDELFTQLQQLLHKAHKEGFVEEQVHGISLTVVSHLAGKVLGGIAFKCNYDLARKEDVLNMHLQMLGDAAQNAEDDLRHEIN